MFPLHRKRIGQVILDKVSHIKTVVNKVGIIESQFRTLPMEVLAGDPNMDVDLKVNGCRFKFNFEKVYWNTKLSEEHERLVHDYFLPGDYLFDAFCGVGPFVIRAAKKGLKVYANDLNPDSVSALLENSRLNKLTANDYRTLEEHKAIELPKNGTINIFNMDARQFLRRSLSSLPPKEFSSTSHIVMNLPATSPEFLDSLIECLPETIEKLPKIHCYCFSSAPSEEERFEEVKKRIQTVMKMDQNIEPFKLRIVRDVSPKKFMVCAHFTLPKQIAYFRQEPQENQKKPKIEDGFS